MLGIIRYSTRVSATKGTRIHATSRKPFRNRFMDLEYLITHWANVRVNLNLTICVIR